MSATARIVYGAGPWPRDIVKWRLGDPRLALSILELHLKSPEWIHHRLHQITFHDDTTVRHCFTVDLTVPPQAPPLRVFQAQEIRLLPLDLLRKQNLVNFEICDQEGQSLSYFTRIQLGSLTSVILIKYAEGLLDEPLPDEIVMFIQKLAARDSANAQASQDTWANMTFANPSVQAVKDRLSRMVEFTSILKRFINNIILLTPTNAPPGTRLKMRYCLDVPIEPFLEAEPEEGLLEKLGWRSTHIDFPLQAAADTEIYHFEVEDPPGVDLAMAAILEYPESANGSPQRPIIRDWQPGGLPRLNLRAVGVQQGSVVAARVDFRSSRQGWLPRFMACSWVVALLLLIGAWRLPYMLDLGRQTEGTDPVGVAAAVLVFLSGVMATLLAKSDEHGLTRKLLSRLRLLASVTAALPGAAVAALLFIPPGPLRWTWLGLAVGALLAAILSTISYAFPKIPKPLIPLEALT